MYPSGIGIEPTSFNFTSTIKSNQDIDSLRWHHYLRHINTRYLSTMASSKLVIGLPPIKSNSTLCEGCVFGKQTKSPYPHAPVTRATQALPLVHTDLCGPMYTPSLRGALYFLLFIDDYSRFRYIYFLQKKSQTLSHFQCYKTLVEKHTSKQILILHFDNGGEFISNDFTSFCELNGIKRHFTNPYGPS